MALLLLKINSWFQINSWHRNEGKSKDFLSLLLHSFVHGFIKKKFVLTADLCIKSFFYFHYALSSTITWIIPPTNALGVFHQKIFLALLLLCSFFILIIDHYFSEEETGGASTEAAAAVAQPVADSPPSRNRSVYWDPRNRSVYWDPRNRSVY